MDADGNPVTAQGLDGHERPVLIAGEFEGGRAPGHTPGTPLMMPNALMVQGVSLHPGQRYRWQLSINGESHEDWVLAFSTRSASGLAQGQVD